MQSVRTPSPDRPAVCVGIVLLASVLAFVSASEEVASWNDGSRLATVECLVDFHTMVIDESSFVKVRRDGSTAPLLARGTFDKIFVNGHFYSDKSPAPALPMAAVYQVWQWATGGTARERPQAFCFLMTFLFSGLAYVLAVWCIFRFGQPLGLPLNLRLALTASFALATVALTYTRHVNNHVLLLGVAAALFLQLAWLSIEAADARWPRLAALGGLAGIAYGIDLGTGPVLFACAGATAAWRCRRMTPIAVFLAAALPGLIVHHTLNYAIGGTFKPANANPEYFLYPGCPFTPESMTGNLKHSVGGLVVYALSMLFGKRGFVGHNLPLFLVLPALAALLWKRGRELPEVLCAAAWVGGTWMAYALTSNNSSGLCCSIRWFVPLLAPAYYLLTLFLKRWPDYLGDLVVLSGGGTVLSAIMWHYGPWITHMVPLFWPIQAATLVAWLAWRTRFQRMPSVSALPAPTAFERAA